MQTIEINELILSPPIGQELNIPDIFYKLEKCLSPLFTITSDIEIIFQDSNALTVQLEGENERGTVTLQHEWVGDSDCCYGCVKRPYLESSHLLDKDDIKRALKTEFDEWDIDLSDIHCQTEEEMYEEVCA